MDILLKYHVAALPFFMVRSSGQSFTTSHLRQSEKSVIQNRNHNLLKAFLTVLNVAHATDVCDRLHFSCHQHFAVPRESPAPVSLPSIHPPHLWSSLMSTFLKICTQIYTVHYNLWFLEQITPWHFVFIHPSRTFVQHSQKFTVTGCCSPNRACSFHWNILEDFWSCMIKPVN